mgnify:CR=1 FL=1
MYFTILALIFVTVAAAFAPAHRLAQGRVIFDDTPDTPAPFGYRMAWVAVRTRDAARVIEVMGLRPQEHANWRTGIGTVYDTSLGETHLYVTPPVNGWTFVYLMVVLKIPIAALLYLVWWAIHQVPDTEPEAQGGDGGSRRDYQRLQFVVGSEVRGPRRVAPRFDRAGCPASEPGHVAGFRHGSQGRFPGGGEQGTRRLARAPGSEGSAPAAAEADGTVALSES